MVALHAMNVMVASHATTLMVVLNAADAMDGLLLLIVLPIEFPITKRAWCF